MNTIFKFRNYLCVCISIMMAVTYLSACSDDKDNPDSDNSIVGTWRHDIGGAHYTLTFNGNGRYSAVERFDSDPEIDTWGGTYSVNNETLILTNDYYPGEIEVYTIILLTSDQLIIRDEEGDSLDFRRSR